MGSRQKQKSDANSLHFQPPLVSWYLLIRQAFGHSWATVFLGFIRTHVIYPSNGTCFLQIKRHCACLQCTNRIFKFIPGNITFLIDFHMLHDGIWYYVTPTILVVECNQQEGRMQEEEISVTRHANITNKSRNLFAFWGWKNTLLFLLSVLLRAV